MQGYIAAAQWDSIDNEQDRFLDAVELGRGEKFRLGRAVCCWARGFKPILTRAAELVETSQHSGWEVIGWNAWLSQVGSGGFLERQALKDSGLEEYLDEAAKILGECAYGYIGSDNLGYFEVNQRRNLLFAVNGV